MTPLVVTIVDKTLSTVRVLRPLLERKLRHRNIIVTTPVVVSLTAASCSHTMVTASRLSSAATARRCFAVSHHWRTLRAVAAKITGPVLSCTGPQAGCCVAKSCCHSEAELEHPSRNHRHQQRLIANCAMALAATTVDRSYSGCCLRLLQPESVAAILVDDFESYCSRRRKSQSYHLRLPQAVTAG